MHLQQQQQHVTVLLIFIHPFDRWVSGPWQHIAAVLIVMSLSYRLLPSSGYHQILTKITIQILN